MTRPGRCSSCNEQILWLLTERGEWAPVNPEPVQAVVELSFAKKPGDIVGFLASGSSARGRPPSDGDVTSPSPIYISHFATCPNAKQHRRRR